MSEKTPPGYAVLNIDAAELAVRMLEAQMRCQRPLPDARATLDVTDTGIRECMARIADAAIRYFVERVQAASPEAHYIEDKPEGTQH